MANRFSKGSLLATTIIAGALAASPAVAQVMDSTPPSQDPVQQSVPTDQTPAPADQATTPALAQDPTAVKDPNVQSAATDQTPATQENPADTPAVNAADAGPSNADIVVTGSRIASPNIVSLAPVQVVGETEINQSGATNLQEVLLENPAFGTPLSSTTNSAFATSSAGSATVNLRNLGDNRTLVLINSRRVVGGISGSAIVDLNSIPTQFIERVDILTGNASSLYGSDAVAGVVNILYKRNFEGLLLEGQYGITELGDNPKYQISATAGGNFMDSRGNIMVHIGYSDDKGLLSRQRANTRIDNSDGFYLTGDPTQYGVPVTPFFSSYTPQGRFTAGGTTFTYGPTGQLQPCFTQNGPVCGFTDANGVFHQQGEGPNGFNRNFFRTLSTPVKRWLMAEQGHFDITDNITFITEATYAKTVARSEVEPFGLDSNNVFLDGQAPIETMVNGVPVLNPFVPPEIAAAATDTNGDGLKDIAFRKRLTGISTRNLEANRHFFRFVTGFEGKLFKDKFSWDLTYNFGRTEESQISNGQVNVLLFRNALAAVPGPNGTIVCGGVNDVGAPCVPINLFGPDSITPAMANYVAAEANHSFKTTQQVFAGNLSGSLIDLPAGPLGIAIGAEYRKEQSTENWDALTNAGLNGGNALPDTQGQFNVREVYGEINVPVLSNMAFAHELNLRAAGRLSDYSTVGTVKTWSLGADYSPIEALRLRGTLAQAVRAPNIGELFTGPSQTFPVGLKDPCADIDPNTPGLQGVGLTGGGALGDNCRAAPGVLQNINANNGVFTLTQIDQQGISGFTSGNPALKQETSHSLTFGAVFAPRTIPALRNVVLSVDYYKIKVDDAVVFVARQTILNQCYQTNDPAFCQLIVRNPTQVGGASPGSLKFINLAGVNASTLKTSGIDTVLQYRTSLDGLMGGLDMNARVSWNHMLTGYVIPFAGQPKNPFMGEIGTPKDKVNGTVALKTDRWGISFSGTYWGKSYEDDVYVAPLDPHVISIKPVFYLDSQINFTPAKTYEFFVGVDNLLDKDAPNILSGSPFNITGSNTAAATYDIFGRRYYAGARLRF